MAWVTERKDMLSGLFFMLTLAAYHVYAIRPFSWWRYGLVIVSFTLGLMSKSMLVTLPFVLILLDYWPLRRIGTVSASYVRLALEKLPLLAALRRVVHHDHLGPNPRSGIQAAGS